MKMIKFMSWFQILSFLWITTSIFYPGKILALSKDSFYYNLKATTISIFFLALATPCQIYPSEYAYGDDSVNRAESGSANCRRYPSSDDDSGFIYTHCDGTQLKLVDSNFGPQQYNSNAYYVWSAGNYGQQLLFIFPTRVSLTTITLHYYCNSDTDNIQSGLPRLKMYAVLDDFDVWDAPTTSNPHKEVAAVPPGGEPAGRRNVSINVNFNTKKVLMYKYSSTFQFAVSEVEFFTCNNYCKPTIGVDHLHKLYTNTAQVSTISDSSVSKTTTTSTKNLLTTVKRKYIIFAANLLICNIMVCSY